MAQLQHFKLPIPAQSHMSIVEDKETLAARLEAQYLQRLESGEFFDCQSCALLGTVDCNSVAESPKQED